MSKDLEQLQQRSLVEAVELIVSSKVLSLRRCCPLIFLLAVTDAAGGNLAVTEGAGVHLATDAKVDATGGEGGEASLGVM